MTLMESIETSTGGYGHIARRIHGILAGCIDVVQSNVGLKADRALREFDTFTFRQ